MTYLCWLIPPHKELDIGSLPSTIAYLIILAFSFAVSPFSGYDATSSHFSNQYGSNKDTSGTAAEIAGGERSNGISRTRACNEIVGGKEDEINICESRNVAEVKAHQKDRDSK